MRMSVLFPDPFGPSTAHRSSAVTSQSIRVSSSRPSRVTPTPDSLSDTSPMAEGYELSGKWQAT